LSRIALALVLIAGCQDNVKTPFPPGLEPLEDNIVPAQQGGAYTEMLRTKSTDNGYLRVYGRGYVLVAPGTLWLASKSPDPNIAKCSTTEQMVTPGAEPQYEYSFVVHYVVRDVLTVEWDDNWRFGTVEGTPEAPTLAMTKHQKTQGSDLITLSEGTIMLDATDDPDVSELSFVEHLDAVGGGAGDVLKNMQHNYDSLVAAAHGTTLPACP
jgi:hypothetical protein